MTETEAWIAETYRDDVTWFLGTRKCAVAYGVLMSGPAGQWLHRAKDGSPVLLEAREDALALSIVVPALSERVRKAAVDRADVVALTIAQDRTVHARLESCAR
jgi:hypothetical protein